VIGIEREGGLDVGAPFAVRLGGPAEDEIEVHIEADRARRSDGRRDVRGRVGAAERRERARRERLRPERDARRAERAPGVEPRAVERRRVCFEGDLVGPEVEAPGDRVTERGDLARVEQARRPAAEERRRDARAAEGRALTHDLLTERREIPRPQRARGRCRREVAVRAPRRAERDVDVERDHRRGRASGFNG